MKSDEIRIVDSNCAKWLRGSSVAVGWAALAASVDRSSGLLVPIEDSMHPNENSKSQAAQRKIEYCTPTTRSDPDCSGLRRTTLRVVIGAVTTRRVVRRSQSGRAAVLNSLG